MFIYVFFHPNAPKAGKHVLTWNDKIVPNKAPIVFILYFFFYQIWIIFLWIKLKENKKSFSSYSFTPYLFISNTSMMGVGKLSRMI